MYELNDKIQWLKNEIDQFLMLMLSWNNYDIHANIPSFTREISGVFPEIIGSYEYYEMSDRYDDRLYWVNQYNRLQQALKSEDIFLLYDVLLHETKTNLEEYQRILAYKGLI